MAKESAEDELAEVLRERKHCYSTVWKAYRDTQISGLWAEEMVWVEGVYRWGAGDLQSV